MSHDPSSPPALPPEPAEGWAPPEPGPAQLPTLDLGQIVDAVIALYRRHWALLLGLSAVLQVPAAILSGLILLPLPERLEAMVGFDPFDPATTFDPTVVLPQPTTEQILAILWPVWLAALVTIVAGTLTTIALAHAVSHLRLGLPASVGGSVGAVLRRLGPILLALITYTVALVGLVVLAFVAFVIPLSLGTGAVGGGPLAFAAVLALAAILVLTIFVSVRWTFWPQAVILDATGPIGSLGRSWRLIAGSTWRVIGYALLFGLATGILQGLLAQVGLIAVDALADLVSDEVHLVLSFGVSTLAALLLAPVVPVAMTLLYLDLRLRRGERLEVTA
ncbi:MAG: hypothetical protein ABWY52_06150 [Candidatus Limnocylindrales bacterium]